MKRLISIILLVAMCTLMLAACNSGSDDSSATSVPTGDKVANEFMNADGYYVPRHEVVDYKDRTFSIIVRGQISGTYQSDDFTTESELYGSLIEDAVAERNNKVEELYNVDLVVYKDDKINESIEKDLMSTTGDYDAIMPTLKYLSILASDAKLHDLKEISTVDYQAPWYDQNCSDAFSFNGKLYFTTGDITILNKVNTPSILFNKEMARKYDYDLYQLVRDKKWTFDKMIELARSVASVNNTDEKDNIYGMVSAYGDAIAFYGSSGKKICEKNDEDIPYLALGNDESTVNIAKKVLDSMNEASKTWLVYAETFPQPIWETSFEVFYSGRALFRPSAFSATTKLRSRSEIEFGILPMPMMDAKQDKYYSYCGTGETAGIAIPISANDPEFSGYMIDAYSAWAKNYITKAYMEINLKTRDARDDESEEMLDIIFDNIVYDIGECYNFGELANTFYSLAQSGSSDVASTFNGKLDKAQNEIDEMIALYGN